MSYNAKKKLEDNIECLKVIKVRQEGNYSPWTEEQELEILQKWSSVVSK